MLTIMRMVVVLPLPLGPIKPKTLPSGTVRERSSTAVTSPKVLVTLEISTAGIGVSGAGGRLASDYVTFTRGQSKNDRHGRPSAGSGVSTFFNATAARTS